MLEEACRRGSATAFGVQIELKVKSIGRKLYHAPVDLCDLPSSKAVQAETGVTPETVYLWRDNRMRGS